MICRLLLTVCEAGRRAPFEDPSAAGALIPGPDGPPLFPGRQAIRAGIGLVLQPFAEEILCLFGSPNILMNFRIITDQLCDGDISFQGFRRKPLMFKILALLVDLMRFCKDGLDSFQQFVFAFKRDISRHTFEDFLHPVESFLAREQPDGLNIKLRDLG